MRFIQVEVQARLRALVAVEDREGVDLAHLGMLLPLNNPALYQVAEVAEGSTVVEPAQETAFQAGIHQYKVIFIQEFGSSLQGAAERVEVIARSRVEAFSLMKSAESLNTFSRVEVQNLQGGVEARMFVERAGHGVVNATSGKVLASRLSLDDARSRFAQELAKPHSGGLHLVDFRSGVNAVLARAG